MMELLAAELQGNPEIDLLLSLRIIQKNIDPPKKAKPPPKKMSLRERLVTGPKTAEIVFPLSEAANTLLVSHMEPSLIGKKKGLADAIKRMISASTTVWEQELTGTVLRFNEEIAAKIVWGNHDYTEYSSLQYLEAHSPEIPAPKPHGLIKFSNACIMLMTYISATTLESVWQSLTTDNKLFVQSKLQSIFSTLRSLKLPSGGNMGGVGGEGVQDYHLDDHEKQHLNTISAFEDFQFSIDVLPPSPAFTTFLRSFLPPSDKECVFTHGDLRPANIMVEQDSNGSYTVSGIIDWEMSGFYPEYMESMQVLHLFNRNVENDWYHYLPHCISPARHPERFLVGRIWDMSLGFAAAKRDKYLR
ncbi:hypothetical protein BJ875DRAFT_250215 [Amylocarpus encephaloides]|uniref:Aminoglycoside phosphotransferase domain-containing protein n=1 Tax=Amylocarpus encephaloides TaxID=45428 RepID=A0A9P7Y729_9HELO|nr:hypothetical protein BJ875DRAFT_250215 [Amylocarpus encephaloides]